MEKRHLHRTHQVINPKVGLQFIYKGQGIDACLAEGNHDSTRLKKLQQDSKNINVIFKEMNFRIFGFFGFCLKLVDKYYIRLFKKIFAAGRKIFFKKIGQN